MKRLPNESELRLLGWLICGLAAVAIAMASEARDGVFFAAGATAGGVVALFAAWVFDKGPDQYRVWRHRGKRRR